MNNFITWIVTAVIYGTILMLGSLGETINEKVGHLNLGVPGIMYTSGFSAYYFVYLYEKNTTHPNAFIVIIIAIFVALIVGALFGLLYSLMCVSFKCNQNVMGLLIASFGVGFGKFLSSVAQLTDAKVSFSGDVFNTGIPFLKDIPIVGELLFGYGFMTYLTIIILILVQVFFNKSRIGLNLRAVGESPATADAVGINVTKYKYFFTALGCGLCGLAGMVYVLQFGHGLWSTNNNIEAIGWLAVALVIFASWKPKNIIWGSCLFGLLFWTYNYLPALIKMPAVKGISELIKMLPYLATIIILIINSFRKKKENQPPMSLGLPYYREER